jgi:hypothetical protein
MILEIVDAAGVRARHRLDALPLTVGRGLGNDVILDDPYVDARHARIALDDAGALSIEDLGSVNGLVANGEGRQHERVALQPGAEVRVGRTVLRVRDPDEPVPAALVDVPAPGPATRSAPLGARLRWLETTPGRLLIAGAATAAVAAYSWSDSVMASAASDVVAGTLAFAIMAAIWAGIWAIASRVSVHRFHFVGHFAVISAIAVAGLGWTILDEWLSFYFPDSTLVVVVSTLLGCVLMTVLVAWHLALSSTMPGRRRWRAGVIVTSALLAIGTLLAITGDDSFTDIPSFSGVVKPVSPGWVPTATVEDFGGVMRDLKDDVDAMALELAER